MCLSLHVLICTISNSKDVGRKLSKLTVLVSFYMFSVINGINLIRIDSD